MPVIHSLLLIYTESYCLLHACRLVHALHAMLPGLHLSFYLCSLSASNSYFIHADCWFVFVMQSLHVNSFLLVIHWCLSINLCNSCSSSCLGWSFSPCLLCGLYSLCLICACLAIYPTYWLYSGGLAVWFIFTIQFMLIT